MYGGLFATRQDAEFYKALYNDAHATLYEQGGRVPAAYVHALARAVVDAAERSDGLLVTKGVLQLAILAPHALRLGSDTGALTELLRLLQLVLGSPAA